MLLHDKRNVDGVNVRSVATYMQQYIVKPWPEAKDCYQSLLMYRRGTRPESKRKSSADKKASEDRDRAPKRERAWALGEALREKGVPWMNGYGMLWACGDYEHALATAFEYVVQRDNMVDNNEIDMLWLGAIAGMELPQIESAFDFDQRILRHTISDVGATPESENVLKSLLGAPSPAALDSGSAEFDPDAYERHREAMKITLRDFAVAQWYQTIPYIERLKDAFDKTKEPYRDRHGTVTQDFWGSRSAVDSLVAVALDLARSSHIPLRSVEISILIVLGQYFNMLDPRLNHGYRTMDYLPRPPLQSGYEFKDIAE